MKKYYTIGGDITVAKDCVHLIKDILELNDIFKVIKYIEHNNYTEILAEVKDVNFAPNIIRGVVAAYQKVTGWSWC